MTDFACHPLTPERWDDFTGFFSQPGHQSHCWCMAWRLRGGDYNKLDDEGRKAALQTLVNAGTPTGILMYSDEKVIGWCSVAPKEIYARLVNTKTMNSIDDQPFWAVVCFVLDPSVRGQHLGAELLRAAAAYAFDQGAQIVEGYPVEPVIGKSGKPKKDSGAYMGTLSMFQTAGFTEVGRTPNGRLIMRKASPH